MMMKRVGAWLLIIGFLLLIVNMFWWQIAMEYVLPVYAVILVVFLYKRMKLDRESREQQEEEYKQRANEQKDAKEVLHDKPEE